MLTHRFVIEAELSPMKALMGGTTAELPRGFVGDAESADSFALMDLDIQLVADRTYFVVEAEGVLAACGDRNQCTTK